MVGAYMHSVVRQSVFGGVFHVPVPQISLDCAIITYG
jgi:hypothetical protein